MKYRAITGENFYYNELKKTCNFILKENINQSELKERLKKSDILDCKSESNFNKKYQSIGKRVQYLNKTLMKIFVETQIENSKFLNLYTIICSERFIAEFMEEVIKLKYTTFDYCLNESDFKNFMQHKEEQSDIVNSWSDAGKKKMIIKIKNFLSEGGFLKKEKDGSYQILKPLVDKDILKAIKINGKEEILRIMLY